MNTLDLKVVTDGDSPRGWQKYTLLHSPKAGFLPRSSKLAFIILFFAVGILLGETWNELGTPAAPSDVEPAPENLKATPDMVYSAVTDKSYIRMKRTSVDLPLAWLMSFPVSTAVGMLCTLRSTRSHTK